MTPVDLALGRGWKVFPCHSIREGVCSCGAPDCGSPGKHPRIANGVLGATSDVTTIRRWAEAWPDANWAVATGVDGPVVADIDVKGANGYESFDQYRESAQLMVPRTLVVRTGSGGRHLYFSVGQPMKNRVNWLPGVDVRADGGYVLLPGSNHVSGGTYVIEADERVAAMPNQMVESIRAGGSSTSTWSAPSEWLSGIPEGDRDNHLFHMACSLRRRLSDDREAVTLLILEAASRCDPPFPEKDALRKVDQAFSQDHADYIDLGRVPFAAPDGVLYDFLADLDPSMVEKIERAVEAAKVRSYSQRVLREERVAKYGEAAAMDGDAFMFGEVSEYVPIWGDVETLLWAETGGLMIASDQGLGKSLTAQQVIAGRLGVGPAELLGLPIATLNPARSVVYLALDRPNQIARSMARLFSDERDREVARTRLRVWTKPVPIDILGDPYAFADWLQDTFGNDIGDLVIDSVKDLTPANLSNGEVGQALDMAWKECRARGMSTLILHHERKTGNEESRANRMPSLDNIYGSVWLTSGMDSIMHIQGKQGENVVTYSHLKQIRAALHPVTAMHDQEHGRTEVLDLGSNSSATEAKIEQVFAVIKRKSVGGEVVSAKDVVEATGIAKATVDRYIKKLVESGRIVQASEYIKSSATPATYRVSDRTGSVDDAAE